MDSFHAIMYLWFSLISVEYFCGPPTLKVVHDPTLSLFIDSYLFSVSILISMQRKWIFLSLKISCNILKSFNFSMALFFQITKPNKWFSTNSNPVWWVEIELKMFLMLCKFVCLFIFVTGIIYRLCVLEICLSHALSHTDAHL